MREGSPLERPAIRPDARKNGPGWRAPAPCSASSLATRSVPE